MGGASMDGVVAVTSIGAIGGVASAKAGSGFVMEISVVAGVGAGAVARVSSCTVGGVTGSISGVSVSTCVTETVGGEGAVGKEAAGEEGAKDDGCGGNGQSQNGVGKGIACGIPGLGMVLGCIQSCGCKLYGLTVQNRICGQPVG